MEDIVAGGPNCEFGFNRADDVFEFVEVAIMQATTAGKLPRSLDRIEFGTVRGKEIQGKAGGVFFPPLSVQAGVVIRGIVGDDDHPSPSPAAGGAELLEKLKEAGPIEFAGFATKHKAAIPQAHGPEISHALAGGGVQQDRAFDFWRDPHATARAMLLKMDLVDRPKIDAVVPHQTLDFFLYAFCTAGSAWANAGRGLRNRKPSGGKIRWHSRS